jgi:RNA polymerase sigma factor (sigma-70 family)
MTDEKRTVCGFEVHLAIHVGEREVLFLLDPTSKETPYIVGYCEGIPAFVAERFVDAVGSDDYLEAVDEFLLRAKGQVDQLRAERESTGEPQEAIGEAHCLPVRFEDGVLDKLLQETALQALSSLPTEDEALIRGIYLEGRTERDLAAQLGISCGAVNKRKAKILQQLRKLLGETQ